LEEVGDDDDWLEDLLEVVLCEEDEDEDVVGWL